MSAMERETPETIDYLWENYHKARGHTVSKSLNTQRYMQLLSNAQAAPMFIFPVPKLVDNSYFILLCQNQEKSFVLTFLEDFKKNPEKANPYMVLTCFDELVRVKGLALMRGDIISHLSQTEGHCIMDQVVDSYLDETKYEQIRQFNHEPQRFDFQKCIDEQIQGFRTKQMELEAKEKKQREEDEIKLGPQKHSKPNMPKIPGMGDHFILDAVNKRIENREKMK